MSLTELIEFSKKIRLVTCECITCGVPFGIPEVMYNSHQRNGGFHHCPNGHQQGWSEGTKERQRKSHQAQLARERASHDQTKAALAESEAKRQRIEERIENGVCPCCSRSFKNVRRHMKSQHPEFA